MRYCISIAIVFLMIASSCNRGISFVLIQPPSDPTVSQTKVNQYINKIFVILIGREPTAQELHDYSNVLISANFDNASRMAVIESIQAKAEYVVYIEQNARYSFLEYLDKITLNNKLHEFIHYLQMDSILEKAFESGFKLEGCQSILDMKTQAQRLENLEYIVEDWEANKIDISDLHLRVVNNYFYDHINMGTSNFVRSCFQNFLFRYPTEYELAQSELMMQGKNALLFHESGSSRDDFLKIFFNSKSYQAAVVRKLYLSYLNREPTFEELTTGIELLRDQSGYENLQVEILSCKHLPFTEISL